MSSDKTEKIRAVPRPSDWTDVLAPEIIRQFVGKHIAIVYKRVVASGTTYDGVLEECIKLFPDETPYLAYIPTPEESTDEDSATVASNSSSESRHKAPSVKAQSVAAEEYEEPYVPVRNGHEPPSSQESETFVSDEAVEQFVVEGTLDLLVIEESSTAASEPSRSSSESYILLISPKSGHVGDMVTVTGEDLTGATEVQFNGVAAAEFTLASEETLKVAVPEGAVTGHVSIISGRGVEYSRSKFSVLYPPLVAEFRPDRGGVGTTLTIEGAHLTGVIGVSFNGADQTVFRSISADTLVLDLPSGAQSGEITVTTAIGTAVTETPFTVIPTPSIAGLSDLSAGIGSSVIINGADFDGAFAVSFGGVPAEFDVISSVSISAVIPHEAVSGPVALTTPGGVASAPENFTIIPAPIISSIEPDSGGVGAIVTITGTHLNGVYFVDFNGVEAAGTTLDSPGSVIVEVPAGASSGPVSLRTPGGAASGPIDFNFVHPPAIVSISPDEAGAEALISIYGAHLIGATSVMFNGLDALDFTVDSESLIRAAVPEGASTGSVRVATPGGTTESEAPFRFVPAPLLFAFSPFSGPVGAELTIEGDYLDALTSITFGAIDAPSFLVLSPGTVAVTVPEGAQSGIVSVETRGGTASSETEFIVVSSPSIVDFLPTLGTIGTLVTVTGSAFAEQCTITFNGTPATEYAVLSPSAIEVKVPEGSTTGPLSISTVGGSTTSIDEFFVLQPPIIESFTPESAGVGATISIGGRYFSDVIEVRLGEVVASFDLDSSDFLTVIVPEHASSASLYIETSAGTANSDREFTVIPAPLLYNFDPVSAPAGTRVLLHGANLSGATSVTLGDRDVDSFEVLAEDSISVQLGGGVTGGFFRVVTTGGAATSDDRFEIIPAPIVDSLTPIAGGVGATIAVLGANLNGVTSVTLNGIAVTEYRELSATELELVVPSGASSGVVQVTTQAGSAETAAKFTFVPAPVIKSFTPASDGTGAKVMITGTHLSGATLVKFDETPANKFTVISATFVSVEVPPEATTGPIGITTPGGTSSSTAPFTVIPQPAIASISPESGPAGTSVTIAGENLNGATRVSLNGVPQKEYFIDSPESIVVEIDVDAESGVLTVTTGGGTAPAPVSFTVVPIPKILSFTPISGPVGTVITVVGANLDRAAGATINDVKANVASVTNSKLKVFVPTDAVSGRISITTPYGECSSETEFEVVTAASIKDVSPNNGVAGSFVTIAGRGFAGAVAVLFGGVHSSSIVVNSNTSITAQVPFGAQTGDLVVQVPSGVTVSSKPFTVPLSIVSIEPSTGPVGTPVLISGTGFTGVSEVDFNGVPAEFTAVSSSAITAYAPVTGLDGPVQIMTPLGSTYSPTSYFYPPAVISLTPDSGPETTLVAIAMSKNIDLSVEECEVEFHHGIRVQPSFVDPMDHVVYVVVPEFAVTGKLRLITRGGSAESPTEFEVTES